MTAAGWLIIGLVLAVIALALIVVWLVSWVLDVERDFADQQDTNHAKCIAHIADYTSNRVVAIAFRDAADRYSTVREEAVLQRLRKTWVQDGPSIPSLWLMEQADRLDPPTETTNLITLSGENV